MRLVKGNFLSWCKSKYFCYILLGKGPNYRNIWSATIASLSKCHPRDYFPVFECLTEVLKTIFLDMDHHQFSDPLMLLGTFTSKEVKEHRNTMIPQPGVHPIVRQKISMFNNLTIKPALQLMKYSGYSKTSEKINSTNPVWPFTFSTALITFSKT